MSPYLFTVATNMLSCLLNKTHANLKFHWKCKDLRLSHLFYAEDVLLFAHGNKESILHIMNTLSTFSLLSGLAPSIHKSSLFFCYCKDTFMEWFDTTYNIPNGSIPVKFLGMPRISSKFSINDCVPLINKITSRIYSWTTTLLSLVSRAQLIKAVLFSIHSYWTNQFLLLGAIQKSIQSLLTRFYWK